MDVKERFLRKLCQFQWFDSYKRRHDYLPASLNGVNSSMYNPPIHFWRMDEDQRQATQLPIDRHVIIAGPHSSGKTLILLHRVHYLAQVYHIPATRMNIMVFGNAQKDHLRSTAGLFEFNQQTFLTFDHWCKLIYQRKIGKELPIDRGTDEPDFIAIRTAVLKLLRSEKKQYQYDAVLIDDGEDLPPIAFEIISLISKHVTVFIHNDCIFEHGSSVSKIKEILGINSRIVLLAHSFIDNRHIASLAAHFLPGDETRQDFLLQNRAGCGTYDVPQMYLASGHKDEMRVVIEILEGCLAREEKIGILFFHHKQVARFAQYFRKVKLEFDILRVRRGKKNEYVSNLKFDNCLPKLITYHGAKGLKFDTVIMPHLLDCSFTDNHRGGIEPLLLLGITRAARQVYMTTYYNTDFAPVIKMLALAKQGYLVSNADDWED